MTSRIKPPLAPMEARLVNQMPQGPEWQYEPKWDGFRCLAFRHGAEVYLQSKAGQPLARYFPEIVEALQCLKAREFVLDGEIVIPVGAALSFDDLLLRIHPAASRVARLVREHPALYIVFDLLTDERGRSLIGQPLSERRQRLRQFAIRFFRGQARLRLSPASRDFRTAQKWLQGAGATLDGVIAKRLDLNYRSGDRTGMMKMKPIRTADCVIGGFRYASEGNAIGSILLGLYNETGLLDHVGFCSGFSAGERQRLKRKLEPLVKPPGFTGHAPGGPSRWSTRRSMEWQPVTPRLVVEVAYDHFTGGRFRHGTKFVRWRPDKAPKQCTFQQIAGMGNASLDLLEEASNRSLLAA